MGESDDTTDDGREHTHTLSSFWTHEKWIKLCNSLSHCGSFPRTRLGSSRGAQNRTEKNSKRSPQRRRSDSQSWDSSGSSSSSSTFRSTTSLSDEGMLAFYGTTHPVPNIFYIIAPKMDRAIVSLLWLIIT